LQKKCEQEERKSVFEVGFSPANPHPFCWFNFGNSAVIFSSMQLPPTLFVYLYQFFLYAIAGILLWLLERRLVHGPFKKK
jgi:hypothetical protein